MIEKIEHIKLSLNVKAYKTVFLDIETSGLSKQQDFIVIIGLLSDETYTSLILEKNKDEKEMLARLLKLLESSDTICTYSNFDLTFINNKLEQHGFDKLVYQHLDLKKLRIIKKLYKKSNRSELELLVNFEREMTITGQPLAKIIKNYIKTNSSDMLEVILSHNKEDLFSCFHLYKLYLLRSIIPISYCKIENNIIVSYEPIDINDFQINNVKFIFKDILEVTIPIVYLTKKRFLTPYTDYFYIQSQNQIVHKSIAKLLPPSARQKLKKETCFIEETDFFLDIGNQPKFCDELTLSDFHNLILELIL
ncbi:MAG: hypothetical protein ATN35_11315 [Epulopiscium sp. Nele67-Bin004]|nr:MAG: hypothetical protein ATN35_11315 [Epulopiscium sp. Nele67-Bin004]